MAKNEANAAVSSVRRQRGAGRPTAGDSEQTKQKILDAARHCFGEQGYKRTSNRMIADRARLTTGTIYHYFENKRDLFLEVHKSTQKTIMSYIVPATEQGSFIGGIQYLLDAFQTMMIEQPNYGKFNSIVRSEARRNPELRAARLDSDWRTMFKELAQIGVRTGEIKASDETTVRNVLSVLILGITQHSIEASDTNHIDALRGIERLLLSDLISENK